MSKVDKSSIVHPFLLVEVMPSVAWRRAVSWNGHSDKLIDSWSGCYLIRDEDEG